MLAHTGYMSVESNELSVSQARDHFSEAINRASFGGQVTYITRGRGHHRTAAIVPAALWEEYEEMVDHEEGRIAQERLDDLEAGRTEPVAADEAAHTLDR